MYEPNLQFDGTALERVSEFKFLGVWFHQTANWNYHIHSLRTELPQKIGMFQKFGSHLPNSVKLPLYYVFVYSRLTYCI